MKAIKILRNILFIAGIILLAFDFLLVLPEYYACKNAYEGEDATTIWGYKADCIGDSAEFTLVFFQLIGAWLVAVFIIIVILHLIYKKQKKNVRSIQR
ncbi:hypothetical protein BAZ12_17875 [Elizabethkingia miricola]|jgi:hypothetical protein|uniref:Uncharacterized protein n=1 Tax=Elizabethkingia miricola TaxID=172045 RepID=A0ABD4DKA0_ELIMR|nr:MULTISPECIES: hypothetical protein [Elizabethkingia]KUY17297.1 hypothetical protein ATB95_13090 [Elizabethkingia miricola]MCL1654413.1 hypothetical protein [Elizabethkingia miricola]OPC72156.1 hypothetical protein BAZ13_05450 [Elizabethkingia miricola]OPC75898.1 hypothetical protein BAZ12_17875 [Elizabethkingia miricola]QCO47845.1 hypothetical protein FCS00_16255 [Elizabethkingia sp. 2-6]